jgi:hypothetical protein
MRHRIAKIDKKPIAEQLRDVSVIASNYLRTGGLVGTDHLMIVFGIELAGEASRVHQVTEQHGELAAFGSNGRQCGWWCGSLRRVDCWGGKRRC